MKFTLKPLALVLLSLSVTREISCILKDVRKLLASRVIKGRKQIPLLTAAKTVKRSLSKKYSHSSEKRLSVSHSSDHKTRLEQNIVVYFLGFMGELSTIM